MNQGYPTWQIPDEVWDEIVRLAQALNLLSFDASNTQYWSRDDSSKLGNLSGKVGEQYFEWLTGIAMNRRIAISDGGTDFCGAIDVKTTTFWKDPWLRVEANRMKAPIYFGVAVNMKTHEARGLGYATKQMVLAAPKQDLGHGPTYVLPPDKLWDGDWFAPRLTALVVRQLTRVAA